MAFKFTVILALIAVASAGLVPETATLVKSVDPLVEHVEPVVSHVDEEFDPHPQYRYAYDVHDTISGDSKSQVEQRDGDVVQGEYSLVDSDGYKRTVKYTADPVNGFQADVQRHPLVQAVAPAVVNTVEPVAHYATAVKSVAPVSHYSVPVATQYAAPVATHYSAPVATHYNAPVATHYASSVSTQYTAPVLSHYTAPVTTYAAAPVAHYSAPSVYSTYSAPRTYITHH